MTTPLEAVLGPGVSGRPVHPAGSATTAEREQPAFGYSYTLWERLVLTTIALSRGSVATPTTGSLGWRVPRGAISLTN